MSFILEFGVGIFFTIFSFVKILFSFNLIAFSFNFVVPFFNLFEVFFGIIIITSFSIKNTFKLNPMSALESFKGVFGCCEEEVEYFL